jgi:hypothetical protein
VNIVEEVQGKSTAFSTENPCQRESIDTHSISAYTNDAFVQVKPDVRSECVQTDKHVNMSLEVRIENSVLKNKVELLQAENDQLK